MSEVGSDCGSSVLSECETTTSQSSSGIEACDVAIFCHRGIYEKAEDAEKILVEEGMTIRLNDRDVPAGRLKLANMYSLAKHSKLRVFIITNKLVSNDFAYHHLRLIENAKISTKKNTLLLMNHKSLQKHIPEHLRDLTCKILDGRLRGEDIASSIRDFSNLQAYGFQNDSDEDLDEEDFNKQRAELSSGVGTDELQKYQQDFVKFKEMFGKVTKKRCYVLISSPIRERTSALKHVTSVPWARVFDFDTKSSVNGLLLWADEDLSKKNHTKSNKPDQVEPLDDNVTNWVSIAGDVENAESLHSRNVVIPEHVTLHHGECLADYCIGQKVPTILVMWYPNNSNMDKTLDGFLSGLRHHLMGRLHSFQCIVCMKEVPNKRTPLHRMLERLDIVNNVIAVPVNVLCNWLQSCTEVPLDSSALYSSKMLPKYEEQGEESASTVEIEEEELVWIRSQLYILVQTEKEERDEEDHQIPKAIETLGEAFLRGAEIKWDLVEYGRYDVRRDMLNEVRQYIEERHIDSGKSGLITIYHAPGGGGTTFARRLLFELHERAPCGELISDKIALKHLEERLVTLRNLTLLPTVILLDGKSMHDVKKVLLTIGTKLRVIVIHVRRYIRSDKAPTGTDKFFLSANVSPEEATGFANVYGKVASNRHMRLKSLFEKSIERSKKKPYIFEYGLTAFESQFEGVRKYVHGYLQVHKTPALENWHQILVFLSMANYYGHRGLPCKLFSKILGKDDNETVELEDLPHAASQFITEEEESWKITHFVVSKLILEQVLVKRHTTDYDSHANSLTKEATDELDTWALKFIDNIKQYVGNAKILASHIWEILTSVFIRRNYDDPGENEIGSRMHFSKLLEDVSSSDKQKVIFITLVDSFPGRAEFRAHLGRFYSKQGEFEEAEKCFKRALEIRKQEIRGQDIGSVSGRHQEHPKGDDVLERIYNMSAFACISHIRSKIGARMGKMNRTTLRGKTLPPLITFCLDKANQAIKNFESGRLYYQRDSNRSFANLGELKVRLQLSELAKYVSNDDLNSLLDKPTPYKDLGGFVLNSFHECDMLLAQCISDRSRNMEIPEEEITFCFNHFNFFYHNATKALESWAGNDKSVHSMKCHLSILKTKLRQNRRYFRLNDDIKTGEEIMKLVHLCEKICDTVWKYSASNFRISSYMMEWLRAIRHRYMSRRYSQTEVLSRIEKWKAKKETGTLANFYHYVLSTMLSIDSISGETANAYAEASHRIKEHMRQNDPTPLHLLDTSEWLGQQENSANDFNTLVHSSDLGEWNGKFWKHPEQIARLRVCTGSILFCRPHDGIITLDGGNNPPINVFFVPQKYGIGLSHSRKKTRVEFYLGFNPRHFAEAYEVAPLKKYPCPNPSCKAPTEISVLGKEPSMRNARCNMCETLVTIPRDL